MSYEIILRCECNHPRAKLATFQRNEGSDLEPWREIGGERVKRPKAVVTYLSGGEVVETGKSADRVKFEVKCKCGTSLTLRGENIWPVLDKLAANGVTQINTQWLKRGTQALKEANP